MLDNDEEEYGLDPNLFLVKMVAIHDFWRKSKSKSAATEDEKDKGKGKKSEEELDELSGNKSKSEINLSASVGSPTKKEKA